MPVRRLSHAAGALVGGGAIITLGLAGTGSPALAAAPSLGTLVLSQDVLHGLSGLPSTATSPTTAVRVGITFANPNLAAQNAAYQAMYTPGSPEYHHFLSASQVTSEFGLPASTFNAVESWATRDGMSVALASANREYLLLSGTAAQAESTFAVTMRTFTSRGTTFYANTTAPTVPANQEVAGVIGLNNLLRAKPAQGTCASSQCVGLTTPEDLWSIYGQPTNLADPSQNFGQGQQMAVLGEGAVAGPLNDLRAFEKEFGLPQVPITIHSAGDDFQDNSGSVEWDIDSQASTGMSPKVSGETWYFAKDLTDASVLSDFQAWSGDPNGPLQANASFGECEQDPASTADGNVGGGISTPEGGGAGNAGAAFTTSAENALQQATLQGKTLFSSTGDTGSSCPLVAAVVIGAGNGVANQGYPETNYPAASAYVVAVGGTVLYSAPNTATAPASNATRTEETSWTHGGGGTTFYIAEPAYQKGITFTDANACVTHQDGTPYATNPQPCRGIPDVAAQSGDIATNGYAITAGGVPDSAGGGTSLSSPLWMGMWTRIQAAVKTATANGFTNGFANPALYSVGLNATQDVADFFDIGGGTTSPPTANGYYTSVPRGAADPTGWDYTSGLGAPNVTALGKDVTGNTTFAPTNVVTVPAPQDCGQPGLNACTAGGGGNSCTNPLDLWDNPAHTATDTLSNSDPQLSLLSGGMSLTTSGTTLRARLTVTNLSETVPTGAGAAEWYAIWQYNGTTWFANASISAVPPGSAPVYGDGTVSVTGSTKQFNNSSNVDTGSFTLGPNGVVEIDVPLANVGNPPSGASLGSPSGQSNILIGESSVGGSLPTVDSGGPDCTYSVGEAPTANTPEAPVTAVLLFAGLATIAVPVARRRRRAQRGQED